MTAERKSYAVYAITRHGIAIAKRLAAALPAADVYLSERFRSESPAGWTPFALPMGPLLERTFPRYDCHVFIVSVGAVVRMIAPLLRNKKVDPAVVCVDDVAQFSICLLSGHVGRGNVFTENVASILGAQAVITTASDAVGTLTVDILGRELGWKLDDPDRNVTRGCAAVVNAAPVAFVQETGEPDWWPLEKALPPGVIYRTSLEQVDPSDFEMLLVVSDRDFREDRPRHWEKSVVFRPQSLVLGLGCDRGATPDMVRRGVGKVFAEHRISMASIAAVATIDKKRDEVAINSIAERLGCPLVCFTAAELDATAGIENPSDTVKFFVGSRGVAEPAALLAAKAERLLVPKTIYTEEGAGRSMTIAVARRPFAARAGGTHV